MEKVYSIWKNGYSVRAAMSAELVGETDKALKFKVLNSVKEYTFFIPKKAIKYDTRVENCINLAPWFMIEGFLRFLFDRYATHYKN